MKARFINEAFEKQNKEVARRNLLFPEYKRLEKELKRDHLPINLDNSPWSDIFLEAGSLKKIIFWNNNIVIIHRTQDHKKEEEFFETFRDILINALDGPLFYGSTTITGSDGTVFYSKK